MLRNKKERKPSTVPEESAQNRKGSIFTDLLTRNRKASAAPSETVQNPKVYTVPDGSPRARKGSTFADLLSRSKKVTTVQENGIPKSTSGLRKPSIIIEEVRYKLDFVLLWGFLSFVLCIDGNFTFFLIVRGSDWSAQVSHPADCEWGQWCHDWRRTHPGPATDHSRKTPHHCGICHCQTWPQVTDAWFYAHIHPSTFFYSLLMQYLSVVCPGMRFTVRSASSFKITTIATATSVAGSCSPSVWAFSLLVSASWRYAQHLYWLL